MGNRGRPRQLAPRRKSDVDTTLHLRKLLGRYASSTVSGYVWTIRSRLSCGQPAAQCRSLRGSHGAGQESALLLHSRTTGRCRPAARALDDEAFTPDGSWSNRVPGGPLKQPSGGRPLHLPSRRTVTESCRRDSGNALLHRLVGWCRVDGRGKKVCLLLDDRLAGILGE